MGKKTFRAPERHVVVCTDTDREGCAGAKKMRRVLKAFEKALEKTKLDRKGRVLCSGSECFGICENGPIAVVHPDEVWYGNLDADGAERIVREHLAKGRVVEELKLS